MNRAWRPDDLRDLGISATDYTAGRRNPESAWLTFYASPAAVRRFRDYLYRPGMERALALWLRPL